MRNLVFLLISVFVFARENPFLPKVEINSPSPIEKVKDFSKLAFNFPDDSRILNKIKLIYTSIDGMKKEYTLDVNERIDWHNVYMLLDAEELTKKAETTSNKPLNEEEKIKKVLDEEYEEKKEKKQEIKEEKKEELRIQIPKKAEFKPLEYYLGNNFSVVVDKNTVIIKTYGKLLRQFTLSKPDRIVCDFKINFILKNMVYNLNNDYIKQIYTGVHKDFYRVVIKLDGKYNYDLKRGKNEYIIKLK